MMENGGDKEDNKVQHCHIQSVSNIKVMPLRVRVILTSIIYTRVAVVCLKNTRASSIVERAYLLKDKVRSLVHEEPQ